MSLESLQNYLDLKISLLQEMGITVVKVDESGVVLKAPADRNFNDKGSIFAGSIVSLATITGWALTHNLLETLGIQGDTLIKRSTIEYRQPLFQDFYARCYLPDAQSVTQFKEHLLTHGKARWKLKVQVGQEDTTAAEFTGTYVVLKK